MTVAAVKFAAKSAVPQAAAAVSSFFHSPSQVSVIRFDAVDDITKTLKYQWMIGLKFLTPHLWGYKEVLQDSITTMISLKGYWSGEGFKMILRNQRKQKNVVLYVGSIRSDAEAIWTGVADVLDLACPFERDWFSAGNPYSED